ncbi:MAG: hypothetical protein ABI740_01220 [Alphaproteobacteria bacterium]
MLLRPFRFRIGSYWLLLPGDAEVAAKVIGPANDGIRAYQMAWTNWTISIGRYVLFLHLDPLQDPEDLKFSIDSQTKGDAITPPITVNGVYDVTHGDYGPRRTWIDWWFKKGDAMLCVCLQSKGIPCLLPSAVELAVHQEIIGSVKYCRDFPQELPPAFS